MKKGRRNSPAFFFFPNQNLLLRAGSRRRLLRIDLLRRGLPLLLRLCTRNGRHGRLARRCGRLPELVLKHRSRRSAPR